MNLGVRVEVVLLNGLVKMLIKDMMSGGVGWEYDGTSNSSGRRVE